MSDEMTDDDGPPEMVAAYNAYAKGGIRWEIPGDEAFIAGWNAAIEAAANIAAQIRHTETELHQTDYDHLPAANKFYINGARRMAEIIRQKLGKR